MKKFFMTIAAGLVLISGSAMADGRDHGRDNRGYDRGHSHYDNRNWNNRYDHRHYDNRGWDRGRYYRDDNVRIRIGIGAPLVYSYPYGGVYYYDNYRPEPVQRCTYYANGARSCRYY